MATVTLMTMNSKSGYVPSTGSTDAYLFDAKLVSKYEGEEALYLLCREQSGEEITLDMLTDVRVETWTSGALEYVERTGNLDVPPGKVVVQCKYLDICTRDEVERRGWIAAN